MIDEKALQRAMADAEPGTVIRLTIEIVIPARESAAKSAPAGERHLSALPRSEESTPAALATPAEERTPLDRLNIELYHKGGRARKVAAWCSAVCHPKDLSVREIERACLAGAIPLEDKGEGKDWRARTVTGEALRAYLTLREAIRSGKEPEPEWWQKVVAERHRRAA